MYDKKNPKYVGAKTDTYDLKYGEHDEDAEEELDTEDEEMSSGYSLQLVHHLITETPPEDRRRRWLMELRRSILSDEGEFRERIQAIQQEALRIHAEMEAQDRETHFTRKPNRHPTRIAERRHRSCHRRRFRILRQP